VLVGVGTTLYVLHWRGRPSVDWTVQKSAQTATACHHHHHPTKTNPPIPQFPIPNSQFPAPRIASSFSTSHSPRLPVSPDPEPSNEKYGVSARPLLQQLIARPHRAAACPSYLGLRISGLTPTSTIQPTTSNELCDKDSSTTNSHARTGAGSSIAYTATTVL
jgi:hypothetical protein